VAILDTKTIPNLGNKGWKGGRDKLLNVKESILIVDDDESICRTLTLIFEKNGYKTETAGSGQEAIEKRKSILT